MRLPDIFNPPSLQEMKKSLKSSAQWLQETANRFLGNIYIYIYIFCCYISIRYEESSNKPNGIQAALGEYAKAKPEIQVLSFLSLKQPLI